MNAKQWKPGDVAADTDNDERAMVVARRSMGCGKFHPDEPHWHYASSDWNPLKVDSIRPLVVIDPEDREQVERLRNLTLSCLRDHIGDYQTDGFTDADLANAMQAALRSLIDPPKPEEPTGLGAVVEDAEGIRWVRAGKTIHSDKPDDWRAIEGDRVGWWSTYADITAARVLSEGVQA